MVPAVDNFQKLRPLLGEVREHDDGFIVGFLDFNPKNEALVELLRALYNEGVISEIDENGHRLFLPDLRSPGTLRLKIDSGNLPGYFETYDSLTARFPDSLPEAFVVWQKDASLAAGYRAAVELLNFLKAKAEVWDGTQGRFFLVDQQALAFPLLYKAVQTLHLPKLVQSVRRFLDPQHLDADTRWIFFRKAAIRFLRELPEEQRLGLLFEHLAAVFERAQQDYSLYLERFSFEDLLRNFDEKRLKFVIDLNQVLSAIQTALIAVPIGFFLIAEKLKPAAGWVGQNIVLASGGVIFFALLFILSLNQGSSLKGIRLALSDFQAEQTTKVTEKSERLKKLLTSTWSQYNRVKCYLWIVRILLVAFSLVIVVALCWCSVPALQRAAPYIGGNETATKQGK